MSSIKPAGDRSSSSTRIRILESAFALFRRRGLAALTMAEVAGAAGISRQALYLHFGTRAHLLVEMIRWRDEVSGISERISEALRSVSSARALGIYVRTWCDYVAEILPIVTIFSAAAVTDPDAAAVWRERMGFLRDRGRSRVIERLAADGLLAEGWTIDEAADWLWSQIHPDNWRHLVEEARWSKKRYVDRLVGALHSVLIRPDALLRANKARRRSTRN